MAIKQRAAIGLLSLLLTGGAAHAAPFVDFEAPTYTADTDINGVDGWTVFNAPTSRVTPAAGLPTVLAGSQSVAVTGNGLYKRPIQTPAGPLPNLIDFQWLAQMDSGATADLYPSDAFNLASTPLGISATGGGAFAVYGSAGQINTGTPVIAGNTYLVEMVLDFSTSNPTFNGYATDLTLGGPRTYLGLGASGRAFGPAAMFQSANGGFYIGKSGGNNVYYDNFEVLVPEPASLGLLSLGAGALLRRRRSA